MTPQRYYSRGEKGSFFVYGAFLHKLVYLLTRVPPHVVRGYMILRRLRIFYLFFSPLSLPLDSPSMIHISDTCNRKPRGPGWHVRELFLNAIPFRRGIITMPEYDVVAECFNLC